MPSLPTDHTLRQCYPFCFAMLTLLLAGPVPVTAQPPGVEPTTKSGTLVEVGKKGRIQVLKYTDDAGEEQELLLTAKIQVEVEASGDSAFLQPGQFIAAVATEANQQLFAGAVTVYLFGKGRVPMGRIVPAPPKLGQSKNAYQVSGAIVAIGQDMDYPEYQRVELKVAGPRAPLMLEEGVDVTVKSTDLSLAAAGTPIELEGTELRNGRFNPTRVVVKLDRPLTVADVFGAAEEGKAGASPDSEPGKEPEASPTDDANKDSAAGSDADADKNSAAGSDADADKDSDAGADGEAGTDE